MAGDRKNIKLQPEDHAELKRRKPDGMPFGEWLLEVTEDRTDVSYVQLTPNQVDEIVNMAGKKAAEEIANEMRNSQ